MAVEILSIAAADYNPGLLLKALDNRGKPLLDVLIENEQKQAGGCWGSVASNCDPARRWWRMRVCNVI
jgi:hypothetical protein